MKKYRDHCLLVVISISCFVTSTVTARSVEYTGPVFDMHLHAATATMNGPTGMALCVHMLETLPAPDPAVPWPETFMAAALNPPCENPIIGPATDQEVIDQTIEQLKLNQAIGVLSGEPERVLDWLARAPNRFIPSIQLNLERDPYGPEQVRRLITEKGFNVIGEISNQYVGIAPDDSRMDGFYAVAAELDIPVAIHMGGGPPGTKPLFPKYRMSAGNPLLLEPVLEKYPNLRISVMHMAEGFSDQLKMMLYTYPNVYVDIGGLSWAKTADEFKRMLLDLVNSGWGGRVMFGSDQMNWPGLISPSIDVIRKADYLTLEQKEAILWSNAIRFLKLDDKRMRMKATAK